MKTETLSYDAPEIRRRAQARYDEINDELVRIITRRGSLDRKDFELAYDVVLATNPN